MRRFVVITGGNIADYQYHRHLLLPEDYLICADSGANHAARLGKVPHLVIGDLDSIDPEVEADLRARGCEMIAFDRKKDWTDTQLALEEAVRRGAEEILLLGALGNRLDHLLANVLLMVPWAARGCHIRLVDEHQEARVAVGPASVIVTGTVGDLVSVIPLSLSVTGIYLEGFYYPLAGATLRIGDTTGISNELVDAEASIKIDTGTILITVVHQAGNVLVIDHE